MYLALFVLQVRLTKMVIVSPRNSRLLQDQTLKTYILLLKRPAATKAILQFLRCFHGNLIFTQVLKKSLYLEQMEKSKKRNWAYNTFGLASDVKTIPFEQIYSNGLKSSVQV